MLEEIVSDKKRKRGKGRTGPRIQAKEIERKRACGANVKGETEPRSTIMMPNSIMINDFSCDRIYFPRAIVVNRNPPIPLETSALDKLKINTRKNK